MKANLLGLISALLLLLSESIFGAQEYFDQFEKIEYSNQSISILGTQDSSGVTSFFISAFDKEYSLNPEQISELSGFRANGIFVTGVSGYESYGGKSITVTLVSSSTSREYDRSHIVVSEENGVSVIRDYLENKPNKLNQPGTH